MQTVTHGNSSSAHLSATKNEKKKKKWVRGELVYYGANRTAILFWAKRLDTQQQIAEQKSKEEISIATVPAQPRYLLPVVILT